MHIRRPKTQSQEQLAVALRLKPESEGALLNWERRRLLIHAGRTALAATLCWALALRFGLHDGYWGAISAIIVMQSNFGATITASRDRIVGTLIGAAFGFGFSAIWHTPWNYIVAVFLAVVLCGLLGFRSSSRLAGVTITIVMLVQSSSHKAIAFDRVIQVMVGILIAVAVSTLVFPDRARLELRNGLAQEFLVLGSFFEAVLITFEGHAAENVAGIRDEAARLVSNNDQLLEASRNEPSGGPGWREGLGTLAQSGRALLDSLIALELAVEGIAGDGYVAELEPALSRLVGDIHTGFEYVAKCIHQWRFHVAPSGLHLEGDIAQLEARMATVRHKGIQFSQDEILRAYAVQLHLKQIARLLRSARLDASRAVGKPGLS